MAQEVAIGRTSQFEYVLKGAWVYRKAPTFTQKYDTLEGFVSELKSGAFGGSWRETPTGTRLIDRFDH